MARKIKLPVAFLAMTVCFAFWMSGCHSSLTVQTSQAATAYAGAVKAINGELVSGRLKVADFHKYIEPYSEAANTALDTLKATQSSDPDSWQKAWTDFQKAMTELNLGRGKAQPATAPTLTTAILVHPGIVEAGSDPVALAMLMATIAETLANMYREGRATTTAEEDQNLKDAFAAKDAAKAELDETVKRLDDQADGSDSA